MDIVVLQGSPNLDGSTAILVAEFARGAREAGHTVERVDVDQLDVAPCTGCVACGMVLGYGCGAPSMTRSTGAPRQAYELGRSL